MLFISFSLSCMIYHIIYIMYLVKHKGSIPDAKPCVEPCHDPRVGMVLLFTTSYETVNLVSCHYQWKMGHQVFMLHGDLSIDGSGTS